MFNKIQKEIDMAWEERKLHASPMTLNAYELQRLQQEQEEKRLQREKDAMETERARQHRDKLFLDELVGSCLEGTPEERFARCIIRMAERGCFAPNPMHPGKDRAVIITDLLKFHGIQIKESKTKPTRDDFEMQASLFVRDPFIRKGDVVLTRRALFPEDNGIPSQPPRTDPDSQELATTEKEVKTNGKSSD